MQEFDKLKTKILSEQDVDDFLSKYCDYFENWISNIYYQNKNYYKYEYNFWNSIEKQIMDLTDCQFNQPNNDFFNFLKQHYNKSYIDDLLKTFKYLPYDYLGYINLLLNLLFKIKGVSYVDDNKIKDFNWLLTIDNDFKNIFDIFLLNLKHYSLRFDSTNNCILSTEHKELMDKLDSESISAIIYKIKSANLDNKIPFIMRLATNMLHLLQKNNDKVRSILSKGSQPPFNSKFLDRLVREANGYFRHRIEDSGDKEATREWLKMNDIDKENIIEKTVTYYLSILAILKDHQFDLTGFYKNFT